MATITATRTWLNSSSSCQFAARTRLLTTTTATRQRLLSRPFDTPAAFLSNVRTMHQSHHVRLDTERTTSSPNDIPPMSSSSSSATRRRQQHPTPASNTSSPAPSTPQAYPHHSPAQQPLSPPPLSARLERKKITSVSELPSRFGKNQIIQIPEQVRQDLEDVVNEFKAPIRFAFAYGSGVFKQAGYTDQDKPLLDFIFAVSHPSHWHAINMQQHPHHYSLPMRLLGSNVVAWMQERGLGAGVWFNVEVQVKGKTIKYGIISVDALCRDMLDWETLYISGRTQKPVRILVDDARVRLANQVNLASALRTSLLLLPSDFTEFDLFKTITSLSYKGDFRMNVGENPNKVENIVKQQLESFRSLYGGLLKSFWKSVHVIGEQPFDQVKSSDGQTKLVRTMRQDVSIEQRARTASKLPEGLRKKIIGFYERKWNFKMATTPTTTNPTDQVDLELLQKKNNQELWQKIVSDQEFQSVLNKSIGQIVGRPTFNQSLKGILSAGPMKSLRYIGPKLKKKWGGSKPTQVLADPKAENKMNDPSQ
ncbi:Mitochondrial translocator assembly and maintenance protein 41 [Microbotryomycetes sp. JL221]|nr:Mitochondrial translocator assembly and maintenance protein 41 [Microbotryomycetes sp. JL221]